ncbi:MAG: 1-deoxy-D-xylulose-5-phosphate reductoisomerase [Hyphomicrobiales bacterium]|nr:MAG: 1-deoxy-D-xylulose-5-phosphate reductoisomerase [Hyphomicrobiales bacterium]|tara:strand:- start:2057 stop:3250 length:1194 start_codon:yes stop_codon:yes gene_type:complete
MKIFYIFGGKLKKELTILGSTGSIGMNALSIPTIEEKFSMLAFVAGRDINSLTRQSIKFKPKYAVISDNQMYSELKNNLFGTGIEAKAGYDEINEIASITSDVVLSAISGSAGIEPTYHTINKTEKLAIANKESIVVAGSLLFDKKMNKSTNIVPVDSEHNAIYKLLNNINSENLQSITITASGGPFLNKSIEDLKHVTLEEALKHPTWNMGKKITIDSSALINKGLELIEATYLFNIDHKNIKILVHPQSIVHAMVSMHDGTTISLMSKADMKIPISDAIFENGESPIFGNLRTSDIKNLTFCDLDNEKFPTINMARDAIDQGMSSIITYNAASEVAVENFISKKISFLDIYKVIKESIKNSKKIEQKVSKNNIEHILLLNKKAKDFATTIIEEVL